LLYRGDSIASRAADGLRQSVETRVDFAGFFAAEFQHQREGRAFGRRGQASIGIYPFEKIKPSAVLCQTLDFGSRFTIGLSIFAHV
jgi:hypothetical protein